MRDRSRPRVPTHGGMVAGTRRLDRGARWRKAGRLYCPDGEAGPTWLATHAALPWADRAVGQETGRTTVYFSPRDDQGRAHVARLEIDLDEMRPLDDAPTPILGPGPLGAFDDRGTTMSCLVRHRGGQYLYYTGWTLGATVPFYCFVGLAIGANDGQSFERASPAPILERSAVDPYLTASPCVLVEGDLWRMWYVSAVGWTLDQGYPRHAYHIRYAESHDGLSWRRDGRVAIDFASSDEYAISRPAVVYHGGRYRMWYAYRGSAYRIGYAESSDGYTWTRLDHLAGIDVSADGWDAEMLAYPHVFQHRGRLALLYNGNGYGRTGFGLAIEDSGADA